MMPCKRPVIPQDLIHRIQNFSTLMQVGMIRIGINSLIIFRPIGMNDIFPELSN